MREIIFRGKRKSDGLWLYGSFIYNMFVECEHGEKCCVIVDNETIGQFTGLKDKNGKEIYEGDIVYKSYGDPLVKERLRGTTGVVEFGKYLVLKDDWGIDHFAMGWHMKFDDKSGCIAIDENFEIIGNIHSNPDYNTTTEDQPSHSLVSR